MIFCNKCKKNIIYNEYIIHKHKIICIFCMSLEAIKKLNLIKNNNNNIFLEYKLHKINKIAIIGKICSGKSFLANYLVENYNFKKYSFADPLKKIAKEYYNMKNKDRILLQDLAEKMKEIDKNVFVNYLVNKIDKEENVVIDDLRFENELLELKKNNFTIIKLKINRTNQLNRYCKLYNKRDINRLNHDSEIEMEFLDKDLIDYELESNEYLLDEMDKIMKF